MSWKKFSVGLDETKRIEFGFQKDRNWSQMNGTKIRLDFRVWELCSWTMIFRDTATILASSRYLFFRSFTRGKLGATEDNQKHIYIYIYICSTKSLQKCLAARPRRSVICLKTDSKQSKVRSVCSLHEPYKTRGGREKGVCLCVCVCVCVCERETIERRRATTRF